MESNMEKCKHCNGSIKEVNAGFSSYVPVKVCNDCKKEVGTFGKKDTITFEPRDYTPLKEVDLPPFADDETVEIVLPKGYMYVNRWVNVLKNTGTQTQLVNLQIQQDPFTVWWPVNPGETLAFPYEYARLSGSVPEGVEASCYGE